MKLSIIVAMDKNRVIGKDNDIPWRIPEDWKYVKEMTTGHSIIMGRKNFESIGRVLPNRENIILTRNKDYMVDGALVVHSMEEALKLCDEKEEVFVFGGEEIYKMFLPYVTKMYITQIDHEFAGDTFFPEIDKDQWNEVSVKKGKKDEKNRYDYYFYVYEKKLN